MGNPLNLSTTDMLMVIIWACGIVLGLLLVILISRAVIKSAVLGALRQHSREQAATARTARVEREPVAPRADPYPFAPGMAAYAAATETNVAAPEPETAAFVPEPETVVLEPDPETAALPQSEKPSND